MKQATEKLADPFRCVHIGDRRSDIYELFCAAHDLGTQFLVRTCVDRLAVAGCTTISKMLRREPVRGTHEIEVLDNKRRICKAKLHFRFSQMMVHPPVGKQKRYPALKLTVIHAYERGTPSDRSPIEWKLLTNLPVDDLLSVIEKLDWYAQRWKIETFHKVLKSGCKAEESKLRTPRTGN